VQYRLSLRWSKFLPTLKYLRRRGNFIRPADNKCLIENTKLKIKTNAEQRNVVLELKLIFFQKPKRDIRQPR
jgi:hypothetical protein